MISVEFLKLLLILNLSGCFFLNIDAIIHNNWVEYNATTGDWTAAIRCHFYFQSQAQISWHYQGRKIEQSDDLLNGLVVNSYEAEEIISTFYIYNFTQEKQGDYTCMMTSSLDEIYFSQWIFFVPTITLYSNKSLNVGDLVNISCSSYPQSEIYWLLPNVSNVAEDLYVENGSVTSNVLFVAQSTTNYASIKCCLKKVDNQRTPLPCSSLYVNVYTMPEVYPQTQCEGLLCQLSCEFKAYPDVDVNDMYWMACDMNDNCSVIPSKNYFDTETSLSISQLENFTVSLNETITCFSHNSEGNVSHQFTLEENFISPVVLFANSYLNNNIGLNINCSFLAYPQPTTSTWFKKKILQNANGWKEITDSERYVIDSQILSVNESSTSLSIEEYDVSEDYAVFSCCVTSAIGQTCAETLASVYIGATLNVSNEFPYDGEMVTVSCQSSGLPAPQTEIVIVTEFDISYTLNVSSNETDKQVTATFVADWYTNNHINIQCYSFDESFIWPRELQHSAVSVNNSAAVVSTKNCSEEDFDKFGSCQLSCTSQRSDFELLEDVRWKYFSESTDDAVDIFEGASYVPISPYRTQLTLNLSDYNAGTYRCWYLYQTNNEESNSSESIYYDFEINPLEKGVNLFDFCNTTHQCLTLDSKCSSSTCECEPPYIYLAINSSTSPACLKGVGPFQFCNINEQCVTAGDNYYCSAENICDCNGTFQDVPEANTYLCLQSVKLGGLCKYDEECILSDAFSHCINTVCQCSDDFVFNQTVNRCVYDYSTTEAPIEEDEGLSMGAVVGIIVGSAAVLIMVICIVGIFIGRRRGLM